MQKNIFIYIGITLYILGTSACSSNKKSEEENKKDSSQVISQLKSENTVLTEEEERIFKKVADNYRFECNLTKPKPFMYSKNVRKYWDKDKLLRAEMIFESDKNTGLYFDIFTDYKVYFDKNAIHYSYSSGGSTRCEGVILLSIQAEPVARVENNALNEIGFWEGARKVYESMKEKDDNNQSGDLPEDLTGNWKGVFDDKVTLKLVIESVNGKKVKGYTKIGKNTQSFQYEGEITDIGDGFKSIRLTEVNGKGKFSLQNTPEGNLQGTWSSGTVTKRVSLELE